MPWLGAWEHDSGHSPTFAHELLERDDSSTKMHMTTIEKMKNVDANQMFIVGYQLSKEYARSYALSSSSSDVVLKTTSLTSRLLSLSLLLDVQFNTSLSGLTFVLETVSQCRAK